MVIPGRRIGPAQGSLPDIDAWACPAAMASDPIVLRTLARLRRAQEGFPQAEVMTAADLEALDIVATELSHLRAFQHARAVEEAKTHAG